MNQEIHQGSSNVFLVKVSMGTRKRELEPKFSEKIRGEIGTRALSGPIDQFLRTVEGPEIASKGLYFSQMALIGPSPLSLTPCLDFSERIVAFRVEALCWRTILRNEKSAQRGSFRPDVPADIRPKTSVRPSKSWKNKHFGTDMPHGRPRKNFLSGAF